MSNTSDNSDNLINSDNRPGSKPKDVSLSAPLRIGDNSFELMTEPELIDYLRIPEVSKSKDYHNVIENLKRMHNLPRVHICGKPLYPLEAIRQWIKEKTINMK